MNLSRTLVLAIIFMLILAALPLVSAGPTVEASIPDITFDEDDDAVGALNLNDYFSGDSQVQFSHVGTDNKLQVTIHDSGLVDIRAPSDWFGSEEVTFIASDGDQKAMDTILVTVRPVNDEPELVVPFPEAGVTFQEDGELLDALDLHHHFQDVDSILSVAHSSQHIQVQIGDGGHVDFSAPANWHGTEDVTFIASDGQGQVDGVVRVTVTSANDAPIALVKADTLGLDSEERSKTLDMRNYFSEVDDE
ncbi:MAG: hypothetical protein JSW28_04080, partial [Thermoplasmata archaeon]